MKKLPDFDTFLDFMMNEYERDEESEYWDFIFEDKISLKSAIVKDKDGTEKLDYVQFAVFIHQQDRIYMLKILHAYHAWLSKELYQKPSSSHSTPQH